MTTVCNYCGSLHRTLICREKNEEIKYGKVTAVADLGLIAKWPHSLGFIFIENIFIHSEKN